MSKRDFSSTPPEWSGTSLKGKISKPSEHPVDNSLINEKNTLLVKLTLGANS